ncbi:MAG: O-antigen ligase family protein [Bryobacteraceae bacterium]
MHQIVANPDLLRFQHPKPGKFVGLLLPVYMFMLCSRVFEATMLIGLPNIYLILVLSALALLMIVFNGGAVRAAKSPCGLLLLLFTLWAIFILPFSSWKSESLHVLTNVWFKSMAAFFIVVGLTTQFSDSKKVFAAVGYGAAASTLLLAITNRYYGGRATSLGSLANANEVAFHIAFGLPFLVLLISRAKAIYKPPLAAIALLSLALSVKTASRGGLLITAAIIAVALLKVSFANKFKIVAACAVGIVVALVAIDKSQLERYRTIIDSGSSSPEALSANESADIRKHKLEQSIELTLKHPAVGVGMGAFIPAAADMSKEIGEHQDWQASHNSYTQISSETGVIGFVIIAAVLIFSLGALLKLHRSARRLRLKEVQSMALCMLLSCLALVIHFFFDAIAYEFYLPMVAGLSTSLICTTLPMIGGAEATQGGNEITCETCLPTTPMAAGIEAPVRSAAGLTPLSTGLAVGSSWEKPLPNQYKLGRRRVVNTK